MKIFWAIALAIMLPVSAFSNDRSEFMSPLELGSKNGLKFEHGSAEVVFFGKGWMASDQSRITPEKGFPREDSVNWNLQGRLNGLTGEDFTITTTITKIGNGRFTYAAKLNTEKETSANEIAWVITLKRNFYAGKELDLDGKKILFPLEPAKIQLATTSNTKKLIIPTQSGTLIITGNLQLLIQDDRQWNKDFSIRIRFTPYRGIIKETQLNMGIEFKPFATEPMDISQSANTGFKDDKPGDMKGGWTDQGPNDLRHINLGKVRLGGVNFNIIDPDTNNGKSCMVFKGRTRQYFMDQAIIDGKGTAPQTLYLLHALAWAPAAKETIGFIEAKYSDGSTDKINVVSHTDVSDWFCPTNNPNGRVVWTGQNSFAYVGLYLSKYHLAGKALERLTLTSNDKAVWMVVAVSGGDDIRMPELFPSYITEGQDWLPIDNPQRIEIGSAMDFSGFSYRHTPAGKYGRIMIKDGHFVAADRPTEPLRFYGINVIGPGQGQAEEIAQYIAAMGYNAARLHHYDQALIDPADPECVKLDPEKIKQLDYLFYCLKKAGLYVSIDLFSMRKIKPGAIPGINRELNAQEYKALVAIDRNAWENWKTFSANLLEHKNEFTGLKWKDDPALFSVCIVNEDNIHHSYNTAGADIKKIFEEDYRKSWTSKELSEYLTDIGVKAYQKSHNFLRGMGVQAYFTAANADLSGTSSYGDLQFQRSTFDYVDNHSYWDHGKYDQKNKRWDMDNRSAVGAGAGSPRDMMTSRIFGRPFMITEFDFCSPNHYRAESGPLIGAYSSLQDWDGLFRFCLYMNKAPMMHFAFNADPISFLSEKIGILCFMRRDVASSPAAFPWVYNRSTASVSSQYSYAGLCVRVGGVPEGERLPSSSMAYSGIKTPAETTMFIPENKSILNTLLKKNIITVNGGNSEQGIYRSSTGELELRPEEDMFKLTSERSECFILPEGRHMTGSNITVKNTRSRAVIAVCALDDRPIRQSESMLVFHLTDVQNSNTEFSDQYHNRLMSGGRFPLLVKKGAAEIVIKSTSPDLKVWALGLDGRRLGNINVHKNAEGFSFSAATVQPSINAPVMIYEIGKK